MLLIIKYLFTCLMEYLLRRYDLRMYHFPYIVELRSDPTLVGCNIFRIARVFFPVWRLVRSNQDGERAEPLAKMLLGAKHAGRPPTVSRIIVKE